MFLLYTAGKSAAKGIAITWSGQSIAAVKNAFSHFIVTGYVESNTNSNGYYEKYAVYLEYNNGSISTPSITHTYASLSGNNFNVTCDEGIRSVHCTCCGV